MLADASSRQAAEQARVWDRFHAAPPGAGTAAGPGTGEATLGLGLPLTRGFIEAHGGAVRLQSAEGKGTTVTMTIPRGTR